MHPQNFMIFGTYERHNAENEMIDIQFMSLCQLLFGRGRKEHEYFLSALADLLSLIFLH